MGDFGTRRDVKVSIDPRPVFRNGRFGGLEGNTDTIPGTTRTLQSFHRKNLDGRRQGKILSEDDTIPNRVLVVFVLQDFFHPHRQGRGEIIEQSTARIEDGAVVMQDHHQEGQGC